MRSCVNGKCVNGKYCWFIVIFPSVLFICFSWSLFHFCPPLGFLGRGLLGSVLPSVPLNCWGVLHRDMKIQVEPVVEECDVPKLLELLHHGVPVSVEFVYVPYKLPHAVRHCRELLSWVLVVCVHGNLGHICGSASVSQSSRAAAVRSWDCRTSRLVSQGIDGVRFAFRRAGELGNSQLASPPEGMSCSRQMPWSCLQSTHFSSRTAVVPV